MLESQTSKTLIAARRAEVQHLAGVLLGCMTLFVWGPSSQDVSMPQVYF